METKICISCKESRALNQFRKRRDGTTLRGRCRRCTRCEAARLKASEES
jgi:hypothetical protein